MIETNIKVTLGGESIYVTPFAYDDSYNEPSHNKIFYYKSPEFAPYPCPNELIGETTAWGMLNKKVGRFNARTRLGWAWILLKRFWHAKIMRLLVALARSIKHKWFDVSYFYRTSVPFVAAEIFQYTFSIPHHLMIVQPEDQRYSDTYYLDPSQDFLEVELEKQLNRPLSKWAIECGVEERRQSYRAWRDQMQKRGLKIGFIASLDT